MDGDQIWLLALDGRSISEAKLALSTAPIEIDMQVTMMLEFDFFNFWLSLIFLKIIIKDNFYNYSIWKTILNDIFYLN